MIEVLGDRVVMTVHVHGGASKTARDSALAELPERPAAAPELERSILAELGVVDHACGRISPGVLPPTRLFEAVLIHADTARQLADDHFTVDGTLLEAWAKPQELPPEGRGATDAGRRR